MPRQTFPASPASVPAARSFVVETLAAAPDELSSTAGLLVSELATNAVRHAGTPSFVVDVDVTPGGRTRVAVTDTGIGHPIPRTPDPTAEHGRGLQLVASLADRWGAHRRRATQEKTVWFELRGSAGDQADEPAGRAEAPSEPAAYSSSGTRSAAHASSTGLTMRHDSSASSPRIERAALRLSTSRSSRP